MILDKFVETTWVSKNKEYYVNLGYEFTKMHDRFFVKIEHLPNKSSVKINAQCDSCGKIRKYSMHRYRDNCVSCKNSEVMRGKWSNPDFARTVTEAAKINGKKIWENNDFRIKKIALSKQLSGEKSPFWNHNKTLEERIKNRKLGDVSRWRKSVYERDNYTCKICLKKSNGNLNAHHLNGWHWAKDERFDINNGITLCVDCHKEFHSTYGQKNNTRKQFEEFKCRNKMT